MKYNENYIRKNIEDVRKKVAQAAVRSGRRPEDIKIVAVTKTIPTELISLAVNQGLTELGENRVQELNQKFDILSKELINEKCNWHLIGHLQTNKVKYIIDKVSMIHSVDSISLADEIQKRAEKINRIINILVQVNIADEATKFGIKKNETLDFVRELSLYKNVKVKGLMTIAPISENTKDIRWVFTELRKLYIDITQENIHNIDMDSLSMGMSNDYEIAIEEGANIVRIGTAIFGKRQY